MGDEELSPPTSGLSLAEQIHLQIKEQGPISLATYMRLCLTHPSSGYYKTADPLGKKGDFVTAPEISQMFGEMLGIWILVHWHALNCPKEFDLVELGPGRGTLMEDALRAITKEPAALAAANLVLLETSPTLIELQREALEKFDPNWISEISELEGRSRPLIVLANEFFDALPINQFQFQNGKWHERQIGLKDNNLVWGLSPTPTPKGVIPPQVTNPDEEAIWETSSLAQQTVAQLSDLINANGGALMIFDYGYAKTQTGDTFQAVANHAFADPLHNPGKADLSAHVNFAALIDTAQNHSVPAQMAGTQGEVLRGLNIQTRAETLIAKNPQKAKIIREELSRLTDPDQMGELFKVMSVFKPIPAPIEQAATLNKYPKISHGFFGRRGGFSTKYLASLNASNVAGDDPINVVRNRDIVMQTLNLTLENLATVKQVHSARVIIVDQKFNIASPPEADGLVSNRPGIGLGILTADCTPVLFADPEAGIVGACHAGWRGAVDGIVKNTIVAMNDLGAKTERIIAAVGPTIWSENYEVGPDFAREFLELHPQGSRYIVKPNNTTREHFDLPGFILGELAEIGVAQVSQVGTCTYGHPELYFSHRFSVHNSFDTGRQIAVIALK